MAFRLTPPGWVAYSIAALVSAVGENRLMPPDPDCRCKVIGGKTGHARDNSSWILGRIVRDIGYWTDGRVREKVNEVLEEKFVKMKKKDAGAAKPLIAGLVVSVYEPSTTIPAGTVARDASFWVGLPTIALQLAVASIACGVYGDWGTLLITLSGTALSLATGLLPQWKREKWACRRGARHDYILTRGNGSQHAILVRGNGRGLNLEDLGSGQVNTVAAAGLATRATLGVLAALWILLLITAAGLQRQTWFLLAVGAIGILHNVYVAGAPRRPESFGVPLDFVEVLGSASVMGALQEVEVRYAGVGRAMLQEFFPGPIPEAEERWWAERRVGAKEGDADAGVGGPEAEAER